MCETNLMHYLAKTEVTFSLIISQFYLTDSVRRYTDRRKTRVSLNSVENIFLLDNLKIIPFHIISCVYYKIQKFQMRLYATSRWNSDVFSGIQLLRKLSDVAHVLNEKVHQSTVIIVVNVMRNLKSDIFMILGN